MTTATTAPRSGYGALWRALPRELGYLFIAFPIAVTGFAITISLFSAGAGTLVTFFLGVLFLIAALYVARGFGTVDLALLRWAGRPPIEKPEWQDARARTGFFGWLRAMFANGHYWLYLLHIGLIDFVITTVTWTITVTWVATGFGGVTYWIWNAFLPRGDHGWFLSRILFRDSVQDHALADGILYFVLGVILLVTLPFITRGLVTLHWLVARGMLGAFRSDALQREVTTLSQSRGGGPVCRGSLVATAGARHPRRSAAAPGAPADGPGRRRAPAR